LLTVFWIHFSERNYAFRTALCSMALGAATVFGIGESVGRVAVGLCFVFGYGVGCFAAIKYKARRR
jgi:hypothetical protein